ncbi:MAG: hypothetical protein COX62_04215 [Deltaproteobacteria bacterium CG_4_10_14_0_2_um_filter_43_8]|nr:MAG: hypothetical protein COV43_04230 [Deltaproteobacteria bacterium CG11_big_fil_rev_8_21_14_0_20_42_23]PJA20674.1 MAG: hypothetical protein COX62_04215 [Deltaproteobacteria bacterium CG_4_10_14_0_2_um_filter_43_8]PJC64478.1 MAG: hypothetical protein CO021_04045 [Deltaproteobacteria bacterium CG_4_9_14_0_2_um_filter_42_21]
MRFHAKNKCELLCCKQQNRQDSPAKALTERISELKEKGETILFRPKHVLFYEGHFASGCFILEEGTLKIEKTQGELMPAKKLLIPQKHLIGLWHLLSDTPLCSSCIAQTKVKAIFIPKTLIISLVDSLLPISQTFTPEHR